MSEELTADFTMRYLGSTEIHASLRRPADDFSITVLFGPSGGGKTTVLRCLAGLEIPSDGAIAFGAQKWFDSATGLMLSPQRRGVGYLSQEHALFPHLRVADNVGFGLSRLPRPQRRQTIAEILDRFGLADLAARFPRQLSGGQQQRVALARALVRRPRLLLLDEPLSALDAPTREELRRDLRRILADAGAPVFLVTHDRVEAIALADQLIVMDGGKILQQGSVHDVFSRPADATVARIVGVESIERGEVLRIEDGLATVRAGGVQLSALAGSATVGNVYVCIRAEDVILQKGNSTSSARNQLAARVLTMDREGPMVRVGLDCGMSLSALITRIACEEMALQIGAAVTAVVKAPAIHLIQAPGM